MEPLTIGLIVVSLMVVMLFLGVPVGFSLGLSAITGMMALRGWDFAFSYVSRVTYTYIASWLYVIVPLFLLMGDVAFAAGVTKGAFELANKWLGWLRGGLAMATIGASTIFAACTGSSVAAVATLGRVALPELKRYGYDDTLSFGSVGSGALLAIMIPPSGAMILYGILTEVSIGKLLMAGFLPGLLSALLFMAFIFGYATFRPSAAPALKISFTWKERFSSLKSTWGAVVLAIIVLGGLYTGITTVTETAALGAGTALLLLFINRGRKSLPDLKAGLWNAASTTSFIFMIVLGANLFTSFLMQTGIPQLLANFLSGFQHSKAIILLMLLLPYIPLGMFLDTASMMFLTLPFVYPAVVAAGIDPIWFGVLLVKLLEISLLTPPVALNVFVLHSLAPEKPMGVIYRAVTPFLAMEFVSLGLLIAFPSISLFIPNMMR